MNRIEKITEKFEKLKAESIDNFNTGIDDNVEKAITKAYREGNDFTTDVTYYAKSGKFLVGACVKGTWTKDDDDAIIVHSVSSWSLLDDGLEISVEELKAMSKEEIDEVVWQCSHDGKEQYIPDEAKEAITNYFDQECREAVAEIKEEEEEVPNLT